MWQKLWDVLSLLDPDLVIEIIQSGVTVYTHQGVESSSESKQLYRGLADLRYDDYPELQDMVVGYITKNTKGEIALIVCEKGEIE